MRTLVAGVLVRGRAERDLASRSKTYYQIAGQEEMMESV